MTYDEITRKHEITDEQLDALTVGEHSIYFDVFLAAAFTTAASVIQGIERANLLMTADPPKQIGFLDLAFIVLPLVSIIIAAIFFFLWRGQQRQVANMKRKLRQRPERPGK